MAMMLGNLTGPDLALAQLEMSRREDVIRLLAERLVEEGAVADVEELSDGVLAREQVETTGIGAGVAIPHMRIRDASGSRVCIATLAQPVDWDAVDDAPVDLVFLLVGDRKLPGQQLRILARISKLVRVDSFLSELRRAETPAQIVQAVQSAEARHF